jgi:Fe-S oxidoreductase
MFGPELIGAFREFKHIFDPAHKMNPGVVVDPEPLDSHLRIGAHYNPRPGRTRSDFTHEGGLAGAALKCVGLGKCRKTDAGTMCPSYMATREEMHSTRGRAHLIYEALTGDLLKEGFADDALHEALDLCLSCKACKTECPAAIDMASYKAEFLANYYVLRWRSLPSHFFGRIHEFARVASLAPGIANAIAGGPGGTLAKRLLGLHPDRALPRFAGQTFRQWFNTRTPLNTGGDEVMLFPDTFNNYFEPEVAIAATEVLERAGFSVTIPPRVLCCGRPLYDQGMLEAARRRLLDLLAILGPYAERGVSVVGLEPSCLLTLRDELPRLFPRLSAVHKLANKAMLLDEFLAKKAPGFAPPELKGRVLVHGHCHQKSLAGMGSELALLARAGELQVEAPDAGCCGMAGAFGYDAHHFEISRAIGDRVLLPAIRDLAADGLIIADGFACRTQIRHFCPDRHPLHIAQVLNQPEATEGLSHTVGASADGSSRP